MKILILYHSGVGSTKLIAEIFQKTFLTLSNENQVSLFSIEEEFAIEDYDLYCIGFPVYHGSPSTSITQFTQNLKSFDVKKPVFIFATCGLYSGNALRIFAKQCLAKNLTPIYSAAYKSPASDGVLLLPNFSFLQKFQKNLHAKIKKDTTILLTRSHICKVKLPRFKFYTLLNFINKKGGEFFKPTIYVNQSKCIKCMKCRKSCPHQCFNSDSEKFPLYTKNQCEHCYRCIHLCPVQALNIRQGKKIKTQLNQAFFKKIKKEINDS